MAGKKLSIKHKLFADLWLLYRNGIRAYQEAYPSASYSTARVNSSDLLTKTDIQEYVQKKLKKVEASAEEAIALLSDHMRGDVGDFMETTTMGYQLDLDKAKKTGLSRLIKKVRQKTITTSTTNTRGTTTDTEIHTQEIELHDQQAAAVNILKIHGKFIERYKIDQTLNVEGVDEMLKKVYGNNKS